MNLLTKLSLVLVAVSGASAMSACGHTEQSKASGYTEVRAADGQDKLISLDGKCTSVSKEALLAVGTHVLPDGTIFDYDQPAFVKDCATFKSLMGTNSCTTFTKKTHTEVQVGYSGDLAQLCDSVTASLKTRCEKTPDFCTNPTPTPTPTPAAVPAP